jgi:hypothetical protein
MGQLAEGFCLRSLFFAQKSALGKYVFGLTFIDFQMGFAINIFR